LAAFLLALKPWDALQVLNTKTGLFEDVLLPEGYVLILPGYTLQRATCGIYKAAAHRVVSYKLQHFQ
jgi:isopenicillin N synthase-like dioxygenase